MQEQALKILEEEPEADYMKELIVFDDELEFTKYVAIKAAQWGSDQELEECCAWLDEHLAYENNVTNNLRADRRPKPKSLKQQAIDELVAAYNADQMDDTTFETLGRIIKSLPD